MICDLLYFVRKLIADDQARMPREFTHQQSRSGTAGRGQQDRPDLRAVATLRTWPRQDGGSVRQRLSRPRLDHIDPQLDERRLWRVEREMKPAIPGQLLAARQRHIVPGM